MKKASIMIVMVCLCIGMLSGCEKTPDEVIVKQKGAEGIKEYESGEQTDSPLKETLGVPEHYTNKSVYQDGALVIDNDAEIILPDVSSIDTISVSAKEVNQKMIDKVTKAFFDGDKIYNGWRYNQWTKDKLQQEITQLKKYKSEGNLDPYEYGKDENGNYYYDIEQLIEKYEERYKTAPEKVEKEEVIPSFGLEYPDGENGEDTYVMEDQFDGVVETKNGNYTYMINYALAPDISFKIDKIREDVNPQEASNWAEGKFIMDGDSESTGMSEKDIEEMLDISYEDAKKTAMEKVEKLGWNMELYDWDYALFHHGEGGITKEKILDTGYIFYFAKSLNGVSITDTDNYGGSLESMDSTMTPWSYEKCMVIVGDDGIQKVEIMNPYEIGKVQTKHVKLMDFDSIIKIYEQMMEVSNADLTEAGEKRTYHVKKIVLGYTRIYDPNTKNDSGVLVPAWDFFGGVDGEWGEDSQKNSGEHSRQSFMTINAIDGTVIDRSLGY